ncbi:hypothetical protein [Methylomonas sp. ZR1]|uniref:hypothetical protein n=1 Tax=Methylomonas sp. ZR1 TaxID=1797072 RepID=UPI001490B6AE|nr:hypothetical protein [Methylomonas sp. ZR1]NOV29037.1 hypothetical protein [Methylomonas sp. ZR1]
MNWQFAASYGVVRSETGRKLACIISADLNACTVVLLDHFDWRKSQVTLARNLNYLAANLKTASIFKGWRLGVFAKTDVL